LKLEAIEKMKLRYIDKSNHPMLGKTPTSFALSKLSKPGNLNTMFGKKQKQNKTTNNKLYRI